MAGAGQWAGSHGSCTSPSPAAASSECWVLGVQGGSTGGSLFLREGRGQQPCEPGWVLSWSCSWSGEAIGDGDRLCGDWVPARGGCSGLPLAPAPLPVPLRAKRSCWSGRPAPPHALHPWGWLGDPGNMLAGQKDTFLCTQATVPSAPGCSGQGSPRLPCWVWGARPRMGLGGSHEPPRCHRESQTSTPVPAAAPGWRRLPTSTRTRGMTWGQAGRCGMGSSRVAPAPTGDGGPGPRGCHPRGWQWGRPGFREQGEVWAGPFIPHRSCRRVSATSLVPPSRRWDPAAAVTYCKYSVCHLLLRDPQRGRGVSGRLGSVSRLFCIPQTFCIFLILLQHEILNSFQ